MRTHRLTKKAAMRVLAAAAGVFIVVLGALALSGPTAANADPPEGHEPGIREVDQQLRKANAPILTSPRDLPPQAQGDDRRPPQIGDERVMLALDNTLGGFYLKTFTLRGATEGSELWVANDLSFPSEGQRDPRSPADNPKFFDYTDCRNGDARTVITDAQVAYMLSQFDGNIRPTDVDWFGEPLTRTGENAVLDDILGLPKKTYFNRSGRDMILVDNVRDGNWYDENNQNTMPYIAGFYTGAMPFYLDRNVITIDAWDWLHRTTGDPLHAPTDDPCTSAPARPFLYEGVFAHEYQHLIHADYDPDEVNWVNEGLSDLAEILTGYSDPSRHIDQEGYDSHTLAFQGWTSVAHPDWNPIPQEHAGPENSLTVWGDQGDLEILEDYGHAYYLMTYLLEHGYGQSFFTAWAHNPLNGIEGLNDTLASVGSSDTFESLFGNVQLSALADAFVDGGASVSGSTTDALQNAAANSTIHFTGDAYDTVGAPPWGSDFIPLGPGSALTSVAFDGDTEFQFAAGPQWVENANGYFSVVASGNYPPNADLSITHEINISGAGQLSFEHYYDTELGWDFGFVQVSDDGGQTWNSVACSGTTSDHDPGAIPSIVANMPGYTGTAGSESDPIAATCDLSAYNGNVLLGFRFMSDPGVQLTGWFVRNVELDGSPVGTAGSLAGWNNEKFYQPANLGFELRLVGLSGDVDGFGHVTNATDVTVVDIPLDSANEGAPTAEQLSSLSGADEVVAIVSGIPEEEDSGIYGPYSLMVNGTEVADGGGGVVTNPW